jgi:protein NrfD
MQRPPYGHRDGPEVQPLPTYFDLPAMKKSHYNWIISSYFFVGGIASAAQVVSSIADLLGKPRDRALVRAGRYFAPVGALISTVLLIADLKKPSRWYNMLRIFRKTSPMSIGAWTLTVFGTLSGLAATAQATDDLWRFRPGRVLARWLGLAATPPAMVVSFYTAVLLSATATPLWSAAYRRLPALFAASAMASGCSTLILMLQALGSTTAAVRPLQRLSLVALTAQLVLAKATEQQWKERQVDEPMERPRRKLVNRLAVTGLGTVVPLTLHAFSLISGRRGRALPAIASLSSLAGTFAERTLILYAGNDSAQRPQDYFRITQPEVSKELSGR